ncbi:hypothetical protein QQS21_000242 [Conoideocrella luteorostrata]|uniref:Rhodopsin domain-containing protein n=1 Tax=Conoideocrella luteorostrata TaxID=1105319 RepID=A0AAJ0FYQ4_9HYPO|nr:hypothetical protein QQS21_000242 [Conoideocrella luteorostrata]
MWFSRDLEIRQQANAIPASQQSPPPSLPTTRPSPPGISYELFIAFLWAGVAVASAFIAGRLYTRLRTSRRLYLDDYLISFAYVLLLVTAALWQWGAKDMYYILNVNAGLVQLDPVDFVKHMRRFLLVSFIVELFFYTILVLFKLSLLYFFKRLGSSAHRFKYFWWPTLVFSLCVYLVAIGDVDYKCLFGSLESITIRCNSPEGTKFLAVTLNVNCALDVLSDFLIMLLPILLLWNVQIRLGKKIALLGIFSLSIITMAVAIARAADIGATQKSNGLPDSTYLWFWSSLQSFLCIVVSCAAAFRQLFVASTRSQEKPAWSPTDSYYKRMASSFRSRQKTPNDADLYGVPSTRQMREDSHNGFNHRSTRDGSEETLQPSSQSPVLTPSPGKPVSACFRGPGWSQPHGNQITKEVEYRVTQHER